MRKVGFFAIICLAEMFAASAAFASDVNTLNLTANANGTTTFTITGVYNSQTPTTAFSSAGASYTLTFTLLTTPNPSTFLEDIVDPVNGGDFGLPAIVDINGITFASSEAIFNEALQGGGVIVCVGAVCPPNDFSPTAWDLVDTTGQLFTGSVLNPTFNSGPDANLDTTFSDYQISTIPEPSSLLLLGTGLLGLGAWGRRRLQA